MRSPMDEFAQKAVKFIEEYGDNYPSDEEALQAFVAQWNQALATGESFLEETVEDRAWELLEEAMLEEEGSKKRLKLARQALELDSDNLDAKQILLEELTPVEELRELKKLERQTLEGLEAPELGWPYLENRPYLSLKYNLIIGYMKQSMYRQAERELKEILLLDENDHQGMRYELMAVYTRLEDYESAKSFFEKDEVAHHEDDQMVLPMLVVALQTGHMMEADFYFKMLYALNPEFEHLLNLLKKKDPAVLQNQIKMSEVGFYQPNSMQSLLLALSRLGDFVGTTYFITWLLETHDAMPKKAKKNGERQDSQIISLARMLNQHLSPGEALRGLSASAERILRQKGLVDFKDFKKKTEEEVAAISGIGKKSMETLKKNGVIFKKKRKK
ncbi:tetratricopeptide repeat protein [Streptococcus oralis]|nr:hypothetical protein [Streptococcus oralis]